MPLLELVQPLRELVEMEGLMERAVRLGVEAISLFKEHAPNSLSLSPFIFVTAWERNTYTYYCKNGQTRRYY